MSGNCNAKHADRPRLVLARAPLTPESLATMYERLTGRAMTPEELEQARKRLDQK